MPLIRTFRGRVVVRTRRSGSTIALTYRSGAPRREVVPFGTYWAEVRKVLTPPDGRAAAG
jgi:hypothetical protein